MLKAFKTLLGFALRDDATVGELTPALPAAEAELASAREASEAAAEAYKAAMLTADDIALRKLREACTDAAIRIDRAEELVRVLRDRMDGAVEREAEAGRVERYELARRQGDEAAEALRELYPQFAGGLVELLRAVAEAEIAVKDANADLPRGAVPLPQVEARVRNLPGLPKEVISEREVERWVRINQTVPGSFDQNEVRPTKGDRGILRVRGLPENEGYPVELRRFTEREFFPAAFSGGVEALALGVSLPGFKEGDPKFFEPVARPYQGGLDPAHVLGKIFELRGRAPHGEPTRTAKTVLIPMNNTPVSHQS